MASLETLSRGKVTQIQLVSPNNVNPLDVVILRKKARILTLNSKL